MKVCLHTSKASQISIQFDEIFEIHFSDKKSKNREKIHHRDILINPDAYIAFKIQRNFEFWTYKYFRSIQINFDFFAVKNS